jgi:Polyketide cyclase / dehydrase and lipid transport
VVNIRGLGLAAAAASAAIGAVGYRLVVDGQLTVDTGVGRRVRPLGPLTVPISAPRETVFEVIAAPYLGPTPRALAGEIEVLERGSDMVLAAHRTPVRWGMVATTVETVRFEPPETVDFRLLRGPVPHVVERFTLEDDAGSTRLVYEGELGTDLWQVGRWWGDQVARTWVATVDESLARVRDEAERRAASTHRLRAPR